MRPWSSSPKNRSTSPGLRDSSSLTLSGVRVVEATAVATSAGSAEAIDEGLQRVGFRLSLTGQKLTSRLRNRATSDKSICSEPLIVRLVNLKTAYICSITLTGLTFSPALAQFAE